MGLNEEEWEDLLNSVMDQKCTPFVGAGACAEWLPIGSKIAHEWAISHNYPLEDSGQLSRVAQFIGIERGHDMYPKIELSRQLKKISAPDFSMEKYKNTALVVLADLNLPVYITTNYDQFMEEALKIRGKDPVREFCRWNKFPDILEENSVFDNAGYKPTSHKPLVYHLHGHLDIPQSMVLTE